VEKAKSGQSEIGFTIGEDLYSVSLQELKERLQILEAETVRISRELTKKQDKLDAAHNLFGR